MTIIKTYRSPHCVTEITDELQYAHDKTIQSISQTIAEAHRLDAHTVYFELIKLIT